MYRGLTYIAKTDEQAEAEMGAFFGAKAAEQAKLRSETMGGPPLNSLILKPYFVGGPETVPGALDVLRQCGAGVVDMVLDRKRVVQGETETLPVVLGGRRCTNKTHTPPPHNPPTTAPPTPTLQPH